MLLSERMILNSGDEILITHGITIRVSCLMIGRMLKKLTQTSHCFRCGPRTGRDNATFLVITEYDVERRDQCVTKAPEDGQLHVFPY